MLRIALLALAVLFVAWFRDDPHWLATLLVFALPPALLAIWAGRSARARFWAGVFALGWFSHGVMAAWSLPHVRGLAWIEVVLALLVIALVSGPGVAARFGKRRARR
ncbi:DUF2069 domain-containing protein [Xanthomonas maliensis]|uniref:DUF2069 domain-containing protein n=1 Tax=Xanthomonas maliensis TaxID=1321368 RepID=UPI0003A448E0